MRLYHGTIFEYAKNIWEYGILVDYKESSRATDFGSGFYATNDYKLALKSAITKYHFHQDDNIDIRPVVLTMKYTAPKTGCLPVRNFQQTDDVWKKFICANRYKEVRENDPNLEHNVDKKYALVTGPVADSQMSDVRQALKQNSYVLTSEILNSLQPYKIENRKPIQFSFHDQKLVSCIELVGYDIIPIGRSW